MPFERLPDVIIIEQLALDKNVEFPRGLKKLNVPVKLCACQRSDLLFCVPDPGQQVSQDEAGSLVCWKCELKFQRPKQHRVGFFPCSFCGETLPVKGDTPIACWRCRTTVTVEKNETRRKPMIMVGLVPPVEEKNIRQDLDGDHIYIAKKLSTIKLLVDFENDRDPKTDEDGRPLFDMVICLLDEKSSFLVYLDMAHIPMVVVLWNKNIDREFLRRTQDEQGVTRSRANLRPAKWLAAENFQDSNSAVVWSRVKFFLQEENYWPLAS